MNESNCLREFLKYTSFHILGMLGVSFYILADTFFVSLGLGTDGLTALNLAIPLYSFMDGCGLMIGTGGGTKYTIKKSMGDDDAADRIFTNAVILVAGFAVFFMLLGGFWSGKILYLFGARDEVLAISRTYLRVILLFAPAFLMNYMLLGFVRNDGGPQLAMAAMIAGSVSNVILDWVFIFPCGMGIFGAAFATGLSPLISIGILSLHLLRKKNGFHLKKCKTEGTLLAGILSSGIPSLITEMSSGIVMIVFNSILLHLQGNVGVAAYSVIANLSLVVIAIYNGLAQGVQPLISGSYGAKNEENIRKFLRYAFTTMLTLSVLLYAILFFFASQITGIFNNEQNALLQSIATEGLRIYFAACPFVGCNIILSMYFTSVERPLPAHIISVLRGFVIIILMAFLLSSILKIIGVWCAFPVTEFIVAALGLRIFLTMRKN